MPPEAERHRQHLPRHGDMNPLPHSPKCERALLGAVLMKPGILPLARTLIPTTDCFHEERNGIIWEAFCRLHDRGQALDVTTVHEQLRASGHLDKVAGMAYLAGLDLDLPDPTGLETYADKVREAWAKRRTIAALLRARQRAWGEEDVRVILADLAAELSAIGVSREVGGEFRCLGEAFQEFDFFAKEPPPPPGVLTGLLDLDRLLSGMKPGQLIVMAARPGSGKTSLARQISIQAARDGHRVAFYSLEMMEGEQATGFIAQLTRGISCQDIASREMTPTQKADATEALEDAAEWAHRILIDDSGGLSAQQIAASSTLANLREPLGLVIVDCLYLVRHQGYQQDTVTQLGAIAQSMKELAKDIRVPVLLIHHLNRSSESEMRRPTQADLRDSGLIEQHADVVMFPWRPAAVGVESKDLGRLELQDVNLETYAEIILAKHRGGQTGRVPVVWIGESTRFESMETRHMEPAPF